MRFDHDCTAHAWTLISRSGVDMNERIQQCVLSQGQLRRGYSRKQQQSFQVQSERYPTPINP